MNLSQTQMSKVKHQVGMKGSHLLKLETQHSTAMYDPSLNTFIIVKHMLFSLSAMRFLTDAKDCTQTVLKTFFYLEETLCFLSEFHA